MALLALFLLLLLLLTQHAYGLPSQDFNGTTNIHALSFSASVFHIDAPASPFYNPNLTNTDRTMRKIRRSRERNGYFKSLTNQSLIRAPVNLEGSEYIMSYSLGNSSFLTYGILDIGSSLIWLQCDPCEICLNQTLPLFRPSSSPTYKSIMYEDPRCGWLDNGGQISVWDNKTCMYAFGYADGALSEGHLSTETFWLDQMESEGHSTITSIPNLVFGCAFRNYEKIKLDVYPPGIIGLDRSNLSLVSQLGVTQFSYCLSSLLPTPINFGSSAIIIGDKTPLLLLDIQDPSYGLHYVTLLSIAVEILDHTETLPIPVEFFERKVDGSGGVLIDSGAVLTHLPSIAFDSLFNHIAERIAPPDREGIYPFKSLELCFDAPYEYFATYSPTVTFQFNGSALKLSIENLWIENGKGWCLAFLRRSFQQNETTIGSHQLMDHNIGYDLSENLLSMQQKDCARGNRNI